MTRRDPPMQIPTVAQRAMEMRQLQLPGSRVSFHGREAHMVANIAPGPFGRLYTCLFKVRPGATSPEVIVLHPNLSMLARGAKIPHVYRHDGPGTLLCLWWPKAREWLPQMSLANTFVPWTAEWLYYFEQWLASGIWSGGGEHPDPRPKRWQGPSRQLS
jgi:hypothetical protein